MPSTNTSKKTPQRSALPVAITAGSVMAGLWDKTKDNLSWEELEWFSGATEQAETMVRDMQDVIEGVGCLVCSDGDTDSCRTGSFQSPDSTANLLFFITQSLDNIKGMIAIGDSASHRLKNILLEKNGRR